MKKYKKLLIVAALCGSFFSGGYSLSLAASMPDTYTNNNVTYNLDHSSGLIGIYFNSTNNTYAVVEYKDNTYAAVNTVKTGTLGDKQNIENGGKVNSGKKNTAVSDNSTVNGGYSNTALNTNSTINGGSYNLAHGDNAVISGGLSNKAYNSFDTVNGGQNNETKADYATVNGGSGNSAQGKYSIINGGINNISSGTYSAVGGGIKNTAGGNTSVVIGGSTNTASGDQSTILGGQNNTTTGVGSVIQGSKTSSASATNSSVLGGQKNTASGENSIVSGGSNNTASNQSTAVVGGWQNTASGSVSTVIGGYNTNASGDYSIGIGGSGNNVTATQALAVTGTGNTASGKFSVVVSGSSNTAAGDNAVVISGGTNTAIGSGTTIVGGINNLTRVSPQSVIIGGQNNYVTGTNAVAIGGNGSISRSTNGVAIGGGVVGPSADNSVSIGSHSVVVNSNGTAIGYEATTNKDGTIAFGHDAGDISGYTITWQQRTDKDSGGNIIKNADGTTNDYTKNPTYTENTYSSAFYNRLVKIANGVDAHDAVTMQQLNDAVANLNTTITNSKEIVGQVDHSSQVASDKNATVTGGRDNRAEGDYASVSGGENNVASGRSASVAGGGDDNSNDKNVASGDYSFAGGGKGNTASGIHSTVLAGADNTASGELSATVGGIHGIASGFNSMVIGGGNWNPYDASESTGDSSIILGGIANKSSGNHSLVLGGVLDTASGEDSIVTGGRSNTASGLYSFLAGGSDNTVIGERASLLGGTRNFSTGYFSVLIGGYGNKAASSYSSVFGGDSNLASGGYYSSIFGGYQNNASGEYSSVFGGYRNQAIGYSSIIVGGLNNTALSKYSLVLGGQNGKALGENSVSIGGATTNASNAVAIGSGAVSTNSSALALGSGSVATVENTISVGHKAGDLAGYSLVEDTDGDTSGDYVIYSWDSDSKASVAKYYTLQSSTYTRDSFNRLVNLADAKDDHDAVNLGQMNKAINDSLQIAGTVIKSSRIGNALDSFDVNKTIGINATVTGGFSNIASGDYASIAGGGNSVASGVGSFVAGGRFNYAAGSHGLDWNESRSANTVIGGMYNTSSAKNSTVIGGSYNKSVGYNALSTGGTGNLTIDNYSSSFGGSGSVVRGENSVAIAGGSTNASNALAIGRNSVSTSQNGIALGYQSTSNKTGTVSFGHDAGDVSGYTVTWSQRTDKDTNGNIIKNPDGTINDYLTSPTISENTYSSAYYNRLVKIADGIDSHDAVTVGQLNKAVAGAGGKNYTAGSDIDISSANAISVKKNGTVVSDDTGLVTGGTVYNATKNLAGYDSDTKDKMSLAGSSGTTIANLKAGTVSSSSLEAVNGSQLYSTNQSISGFAKDIASNTSKLTELSNSVSNANNSATTAISLANGLDSSKADTSLSNLSDSGKSVIAAAAKEAVQNYFKSASSTSSAKSAMMKASMFRMPAKNAVVSLADAVSNTIVTPENSPVIYNSSYDNYSRITLSGPTGTGTVIENVADGLVAQGSKEAVNGGQLYDLKETVEGYQPQIDTMNTTIGQHTSLLASHTAKIAAMNRDVNIVKTAMDNGILFSVDNASLKKVNASDNTFDFKTGDNVKLESTGNGLKISVKADGQIAHGNTGLVTGGTVYDYVDNALQNITVDTSNLADKDLSNLSDKGKESIKSVMMDDMAKKADKSYVDDSLSRKLDADGSNMDVSAFTEKLNTGKVESGNAGLVSGSTVYEALTKVSGGNNLIQSNDGVITIGKDDGASKVSLAGQNGASRVVTGVAFDASDMTSAANVGYVNAMTMGTAESLQKEMNGMYSSLSKDINRASAGSNALAALHPLDYDSSDKLNFAVGYGHYRNANATAFGAYYYPNANTMVSIGTTVGNGSSSVNAGLSFKVGKGSPYAGISKVEMASAIQTLAKKDVSKDAEIQALKDENNDIRQENQEIKKELAELKAYVQSLKK